MGTETDADRVRLTVPAEPVMVDVIRAAVRSLCARVGLGDVAIEATRTSVGEAFLQLVDSGAEEVVLDAQVQGADLDIDLTAGTHARRVSARRGR